MNDEFEKALAKVRFEESPTTVGNPFKYAFNKGANWAFEWCEDKIEQAFHIQRTERTRVEHWEAKLQRQDEMLKVAEDGLDKLVKGKQINAADKVECIIWMDQARALARETLTKLQELRERDE